MSAFNITTHADVVRFAEWVAEGITPATYAVTPTNPAMTACGVDCELTIDQDPVGRERRTVGSVDRKQKLKVREKNTATLSMHIVDSNFWKWATQLPTGALTPLESRTIADSRKLDGTETFRIIKGCKPVSATMRIPNDDFITIEVQVEYKTFTDTASDFIGAGSHATALAGTPWYHGDGGNGKFTYNTAVTLEKGFTVNVNWEMGRLDSSGDIVDLYMKNDIRRVSGSVSAFRKNTTLDADAALLTPRDSTTLVLKAGVSTITFTQFQLQKRSEGYSGNDSNSSIAEYPIEADIISTT